MRVLHVLLAAAIGAATSASAESETPPVPEKPKLICKTFQVTGSRLGSTRQCETSEEWARQRREHQADIENKQKIGIRDGGG